MGINPRSPAHQALLEEVHNDPYSYMLINIYLDAWAEGFAACIKALHDGLPMGEIYDLDHADMRVLALGALENAQNKAKLQALIATAEIGKRLGGNPPP